jgi:hypothetical protein
MYDMCDYQFIESPQRKAKEKKNAIATNVDAIHIYLPLLLSVFALVP